ncbi:MAG: hypothetical protein ABH834_06335 [Candidatus Altiarchaeota archaeon]
MVYMQVPFHMMIDWGDNWSFLTVVEIIKAELHLPREDLFFGGIPYVYPPISLITYAILYTILPVSYTFLSNNIAPIIGSFTVFGVYLLAWKLSGNKWVGVLAAYLSIFTPRYLALSSIPIPEMFGHLQAPIIMYLAYVTAKSRNKNHALLTGMAGATLFLNHHLTSAILFLSVTVYFLTLYTIKLHFDYLKLLVIILAVSFILSSPWWFDTVSKNIMNLVVREQEYAVPPFRDYVAMLSPFNFYTGSVAVAAITLLVIAFFILNLAARLGLDKKSIPQILFEKQEAVALLFAWCGFTLLATQSRNIVRILLEEAVKKNPNLLLVLAPIYGERYFDYMAQPFAIANAMLLACLFTAAASLISRGMKKKKKQKTIKIMALACSILVFYPTITFGFGIDDPLLEKLDAAIREAGLPDPHLDIANWALWRMKPDVNDSVEYEASLWMRENLAPDANIVADYPSGEVISAGALRRIVGGAELRVTVDVVGVYSDILVIYYTDSVDEAITLMRKRNATHVYISDRIINRGWLPITSHSRWPRYNIGAGMKQTNEKKFAESQCFEKIYDKDKIRIYELVC